MPLPSRYRAPGRTPEDHLAKARSAMSAAIRELSSAEIFVRRAASGASTTTADRIWKIAEEAKAVRMMLE